MMILKTNQNDLLLFLVCLDCDKDSLVKYHELLSLRLLGRRARDLSVQAACLCWRKTTLFTAANFEVFFGIPYY